MVYFNLHSISARDTFKMKLIIAWSIVISFLGLMLYSGIKTIKDWYKDALAIIILLAFTALVFWATTIIVDHYMNSQTL